MAKICVFCSSIDGLHQDYIDTARKTGQLLAQENHHLIYGGSHRGLMGELSKEFAKLSDKITEIIPRMWTNLIVKKRNAIITESFGDRLKKMQEHADAFITLPGGFGSIHEIMDVLVAKQVNIHTKPLIIINTNGIYDPFIEQIKKTCNEGFAPKDNHKLIKIVDTPEEALEYIKNYAQIKSDYNPKLDQ